jgi:hypothetical protein
MRALGGYFVTISLGWLVDASGDQALWNASQTVTSGPLC